VRSIGLLVSPKTAFFKFYSLNDEKTALWICGWSYCCVGVAVTVGIAVTVGNGVGVAVGNGVGVAVGNGVGVAVGNGVGVAVGNGVGVGFGVGVGVAEETTVCWLCGP
jgi:hypothetical protein